MTERQTDRNSARFNYLRWNTARFSYMRWAIPELFKLSQCFHRLTGSSVVIWKDVWDMLSEKNKVQDSMPTWEGEIVPELLCLHKSLVMIYKMLITLWGWVGMSGGTGICLRLTSLCLVIVLLVFEQLKLITCLKLK